MKLSKRIRNLTLVIFMFFSIFSTSILANSQGYVEVQITFNEEYMKNGRDALTRVEIAKAEYEGKQFTSLEHAVSTVNKLYSADADGKYTSAEGVTPKHENANPLYYRASDTPSDAEKGPIRSIKYVIHGSITSTSKNAIDVSLGTGYLVNDIQIIGVDGATIKDCGGINAVVAGGYKETFVEKGTLLVKGIHFDSQLNNIVIVANGNSYAPTKNDKQALECNTIIESCFFENMLYMYVNDPNSINQNITIKNNVFSNKLSTSYAIFIQPDAVTHTQGGNIVITGNTIQNYKRGINIQARTNANVEISNNTIQNIDDVGGCAVQITNCKNINIINNTISKIKYNVIRVHELAKDVQSVNIKNNKITDCGYMIFVEPMKGGDKDAIDKKNIHFDKNQITNVNIAQGYNKDAPEGSKIVAHSISSSIFGDLFLMDVVFVDVDGSVLSKQTVLFNEKAIKPLAPVKKGYRFEAWTDDTGKEFNFNSLLTNHKTLYAKWFKYVNEEVNVPTLPTKPVDKPTVGVTDSKAVEVISKTASNLIDSIVNGGTVDTSIISTAVQEKIIEAMAAGKEITTKVESTPIDAAKVEKAVVTKVENAIKKLETANKSEIVIAQYLDLGIALEAEGTKLGNINKLEEPIKFTVALPSELKVEGRKYYVVIIHGEETTLIEATLNEDGTLTFETDEFSMYALVYEDVKLETPAPTPGVDTGDTTNTTMLFIMLVAAGSLGVYTTKRRMRKN